MCFLAERQENGWNPFSCADTQDIKNKIRVSTLFLDICSTSFLAVTRKYNGRPASEKGGAL